MSSEPLGKGLKSLIPEDFAADSEGRDTVSYIETGRITISDHQPRKTLNDKTVDELAESIKEHGIIQPLVVTKSQDGNYQLIAGQRRLLASRKLGLSEVPAIIKSQDPRSEMEIALIENIQREDLNSIEEAEAYKSIMDRFELTSSDLAAKVGKGESTVINSLRLLTLSPAVRDAVKEGKITAGHARALVTLPKEEQEKKLAEIISLGLNVREVESRVKGFNKPSLPQTGEEEDLDLKSFTEQLRTALGAKVGIQKKGKGGRITIDYYSKEELERIVEHILSTKMDS